jgi:hypothetical protein
MRFAFACVVLAACLEPTEIVVDVKTSYTCAGTDAVVFVGGKNVLEGSTAFTGEKTTCDNDGEVGTLVAIPSTGSGDVYLRVVAGVDGTKGSSCVGVRMPGTQCIEARRVLRFVRHTRLTLPVTLDRNCVNIECPAMQTCENGLCVNDVVTDPSCIADPAKCPDAGPPTMPDAGADGGPVGSAVHVLGAGFDTACATRSSDDALFCWGANAGRQLGPNGPNGPVGGVTLVPRPSNITKTITTIAVGQSFVCVTDGLAVSCWGASVEGQLGRSPSWGANPDPMSAPVVGTWASVASLTAGATFACALNGAKTTCWGTVTKGLVYQIPMPITGDPGFGQIAAGAEHVCGYTATEKACTCPTNCFPCTLPNATFWCWGSNASAQCNATAMAPSIFLQPSGLTNIPTTLVGAGFDHTAGFGSYLNKGDLAAFGGMIGCNANPPPKTPKQLAFTGSQLYALETDGSVDAMGPSSCLPVQAIASNATQIGAGTGFVCYVTSTSKLFCTGQLAPVVSTNMPVEIMLP